MYGKKLMGTIRSTFVIDEKGKIEHIWSPVKVNGHVDQVLAALQGKVVPAGKTTAAKKITKKKAPGKKAAKKK
jgi:peroxiredoxin Q/BCP